LPHVDASQGTPTRSPRANESTTIAGIDHRADDLVSGMTGERASGNSPSTTCRSVRQTPQASTFTTIVPRRAADRRRSEARAAA
jgi:hypothetical protein